MSALSVPIRCSTLCKGDQVLIKGRPCKVMELTTSKPGKHGHAKVNFVGVDIFTKKRIEHSCPSSSNVDIPYIHKRECTLVNIEEDGFMSLLTPTGEIKDDIPVPDGELGRKIRREFDAGNQLTVVLTSSMGEEHCTDYKMA